MSRMHLSRRQVSRLQLGVAKEDHFIIRCFNDVFSAMVCMHSLLAQDRKILGAIVFQGVLPALLLAIYACDPTCPIPSLCQLTGKEQRGGLGSGEGQMDGIGSEEKGRGTCEHLVRQEFPQIRQIANALLQEVEPRPVLCEALVDLLHSHYHIPSPAHTLHESERGDYPSARDVLGGDTSGEAMRLTAVLEGYEQEAGDLLVSPLLLVGSLMKIAYVEHWFRIGLMHVLPLLLASLSSVRAVFMNGIDSREPYRKESIGNLSCTPQEIVESLRLCYKLIKIVRPLQVAQYIAQHKSTAPDATHMQAEIVRDEDGSGVADKEQDGETRAKEGMGRWKERDVGGADEKTTEAATNSQQEKRGDGAVNLAALSQFEMERVHATVMHCVTIYSEYFRCAVDLLVRAQGEDGRGGNESAHISSSVREISGLYNMGTEGRRRLPGTRAAELKQYHHMKAVRKQGWRLVL